MNTPAEARVRVLSFKEEPRLARGNYDVATVQDNGVLVVDGDVRHAVASCSGELHITGDVETASASDHGTLIIEGTVTRAIAKHSGSITTYGDIEVARAQDHGLIRASGVITDAIASFSGSILGLDVINTKTQDHGSVHSRKAMGEKSS